MDEDEHNLTSVSYSKMVTVLWGQVKALKEDVAILNEKVKTLESK